MTTRVMSLMGLLSLRGAEPQQDDQRQDAGCNIEMHECHRGLSSTTVVDRRMAIPRNTTVITRPDVSVTQGMPWTAPGTKRPTTSDAKMIFAPSRKKPATTSEAVFITPVALPRRSTGCQASRPMRLTGWQVIGLARRWPVKRLRGLGKSAEGRPMCEDIQPQQAFDRTFRRQVVSNHLHVLECQPQAPERPDTQERYDDEAVGGRQLEVSLGLRGVIAHVEEQIGRQHRIRGSRIERHLEAAPGSGTGDDGIHGQQLRGASSGGLTRHGRRRRNLWGSRRPNRRSTQPQ